MTIELGAHLCELLEVIVVLGFFLGAGMIFLGLVKLLIVGGEQK